MTYTNAFSGLLDQVYINAMLNYVSPGVATLELPPGRYYIEWYFAVDYTISSMSISGLGVVLSLMTSVFTGDTGTLVYELIPQNTGMMYLYFNSVYTYGLYSEGLISIYQ